MSDTPETDAAMLLEREGITHPELHETYIAWTDYWALGQHARSLERRLRETQAELESARTALFSEGARSGAAKAERDTALREAEEHKSRCTVLEAEVAEWKSQFAAALAEKGKP